VRWDLGPRSLVRPVSSVEADAPVSPSPPAASWPTAMTRPLSATAGA